MQKSTIRKSDNIIIWSVFLATLLHVISLVCVNLLPKSDVIFDWYLHIIQPFIHSLVEIIGGFLLFWYARRLKACAYTRISTLLYLILILISFSYVLIVGGYIVYVNFFGSVFIKLIDYYTLLNTTTFVLSIGIGILFLLYLFQPLLRMLHNKISKK